jgi:hypothetical protein
VRLDHLLSKEYMSSDRACTIAMAYNNLKSTTDISLTCHPEERALARVSKDAWRVAKAEESIGHFDRMAGS